MPAELDDEPVLARSLKAAASELEDEARSRPAPSSQRLVSGRRQGRQEP
jgi:hypothetical protein